MLRPDWRRNVNQAAVDALRRATLPAAVLALVALSWAAWLPTPWGPAPNFYGPNISAPVTFHLVFFHPAAAWASFIAYGITFALSIAYLSERRLRDDATARAAAEAGFLMNTIALATGTLWGLQEWYRAGQNGLATVYTDWKVLVVVILWLTFAAYLMLRRLVDGAERRARLSAAFGILGFLGVPASFLTSKVLSTDLHPDLSGSSTDTNSWHLSSYDGLVLLWSFIAFTLLFVHLFLARLRLARLEDRLDLLEDLEETQHAQ